MTMFGSTYVCEACFFAITIIELKSFTLWQMSIC